MGAILSRLRRTDDGDYEKILSQLDSQIRRAELAIANIRSRERQFSVAFHLYSILAYVFYVALYYIYLRRTGDTPRVWLLKIVPIVVLPMAIWAMSRATSYLYRRKQVSEETHLENLKKKQKLTVEELKRRTSYYSTRSLIERYDPGLRDEFLAKQKADEEAANKMAAAMLGTPAREQRAMTTGHVGTTGVRQRVPHGQPLPPMSTPAGASRRLIDDPNSPDMVSPFNVSSFLSPQPQIPRTFMDRVLDTIVGNDDASPGQGAEQRYALVCGKCYTHNGLALPADYDDIQYVCPRCGHFNPSRRSGANPMAPLLSPTTQPHSEGSEAEIGPERSGSPSIMHMPPIAPMTPDQHRPTAMAEEAEDEDMELVQAESGAES